MRRTALALIVGLILLPTAARAASWSFSTPYGSTSWSLDASAGSGAGAGAGALTLNSNAVSWNFAVDKSSTTATGSATVNDQAYSGSFDWSNLLSWLFG